MKCGTISEEPKYHVTAQVVCVGESAKRAIPVEESQLNSSRAMTPYYADPRVVLALDSMANICVMPEDIVSYFRERYNWIVKKLKKPVHMGAVSNDGTVVLEYIVINPNNKFQPPLYVAPKGTMTICTTDYISRLGLFFCILPYQQGFVIKRSRGQVLYQGKVAPDKFHYIEWEVFNDLRPVDSCVFQGGLSSSDFEDFIHDVCSELDVINDNVGTEYVACLHWGFTGYHLFEDYSNGWVYVVGHKNHDGSHLIASIQALNIECNANGHYIKEMVSDAGSVEKSTDVKKTCSDLGFNMVPLPSDMQHLNIVERSIQSIDDKINPTIAAAIAGCPLGDNLWFSALMNVVKSHNCAIHASRMVTRHEDFYKCAPNIDAMFRFRLGEYVTVSEALHKRAKTEHVNRSTICIALHSQVTGHEGQGTWIWNPNKRTAYLRGNIYLNSVKYPGIPNQSMMVQDDIPHTKGEMSYPDASIVKFIERHVDLECANVDKMDVSIADCDSADIISPMSVQHNDPVDMPVAAVESISTSGDDNAVTVTPSIDDLIGVRVRKKFGNRFYSGTVVSFLDPYYKVDLDDGDQEEYTPCEIQKLQIKSINSTMTNTIHVPRSEFSVKQAYIEDKLGWAPVIKSLFADAISNIKSIRPCHRRDVPADAIVLPASAVCKVKADPKQEGHVMIRKARLVVQHSKRRFPMEQHDMVHATVARVKNVRFVIALAAWIHAPYVLADIKTAFPTTPLTPDLVGRVYLEFPKCLELPADTMFEMLTFVEGFQLSNSGFDAHLGKGLAKYGFRICPNDSQLITIMTPQSDFLVAVKVVDNFLIVSTCDALKDLLFEAVRYSGYIILEEANDKFIGTQLQRMVDGSIGVHQEYHARKLITKYGITQTAPTPLSSTFTTENYIVSRTSEPIPIKIYQSIIGDIIWLTITRYDIQLGMSVLSQKTHYCSQRDYDEAKHVLMYVLKNPGQPLIFHRAPVHQRPVSLRCVLDMPVFIMGSTDSAHRSAGPFTNPRDQIAHFIKVFSPINAAIFACSKVAGPTTSSCEAENNGTVSLLQEELDTYFVFNWIGFRNIAQMLIEGDNTSNGSLCTTISSSSRKKSRHFVGNANWVKEFVDLNLLRIVHTPGSNLVSNALTKRVSEEEQSWSTDDMRGFIRRCSEVDRLPHVPIRRSDHIARWPVIECSAKADRG